MKMLVIEASSATSMDKNFQAALFQATLLLRQEQRSSCMRVEESQEMRQQLMSRLPWTTLTKLAA